jgi:ubiquinone/menaquinone biosynthesis C-methylase UbiE
MDPTTRAATQAGYDAVAEEYATRFFDELAAKPLDRAMLDCLVEMTRGLGMIADIGCGPGQIARHLTDHGAEAMGIDLSPEMVKLAQRLSPDIPFHVGDMLALDLENNSLGGIAAFYSVIHAPPEQIPQVMREFYRVLHPGGLALLAFHIGEEVKHLEEWWEKPVSLDFHFYQPATLARRLEAAGFRIEAKIERAPYVGSVEHPSQRGYLLGRKLE